MLIFSTLRVTYTEHWVLQDILELTPNCSISFNNHNVCNFNKPSKIKNLGTILQVCIVDGVQGQIQILAAKQQVNVITNQKAKKISIDPRIHDKQ